MGHIFTRIIGRPKNINTILSELYYSPKNPASFSSSEKLYNAAQKFNPKITLQQVKNWLSSQYTYTLHKNVKRKFERNKIFVIQIDQQWQADLVDLQNFAKENQNCKYLLTVIDCFLKYAWVIPIKQKTANEVIETFKIIFQEKKPQYLQTDKGKEFLNKNFLNYLESKNVKHFTSHNDKIKCAIIERFNRTLKEKMFKYFTAVGSRKYIDILQDLVTSYNKSVHRTIKLAPENVSKENENEVFLTFTAFHLFFILKILKHMIN